MTIIDRYILRQFLLNFILLFMLLFIFTCMIDLFLNVDRFIEAVEATIPAEGLGRLARARATTWMVFDFYWPRLFQFYSFLLGIISIGAVGFTLVQMHRHREMTAVLAAGVSLHRIAMPLILAIVGLNLLQLLNREVVLPRLAPLLLRNHGEIGRTAVEGFRVNMAGDGPQRVLLAKWFSPAEGRLDRPFIWEYDASDELARIITAESATWRGDGWALSNGRATRLSREDLTTAPPPEPIDFIASQLDPNGLLMRRHLEFRQMLSLRQIGDLVERESTRGIEDLIRMRFGRFSQVLINILSLLITLPFFLIREPKNLLVQAVNCSAVGLTAQIGGAVGVTIGIPIIAPAASVFFIPLLILLPIAVWRMIGVET